jgi:hypothetical protein
VGNENSSMFIGFNSDECNYLYSLIHETLLLQEDNYCPAGT